MSDYNYSFELSLIIPFYNEEARVHHLYEGLINFSKKYNDKYEVILVNDGSKDSSESKIKEHPHYKELDDKGIIKIITLNGNSGKGGALQKGVAESQGKFILTLDFDMATDPITIEHWKKLEGGKYKENEIWIGSRPHPKSQLKEKPLRKFVGIVFNPHSV